MWSIIWSFFRKKNSSLIDAYIQNNDVFIYHILPILNSVDNNSLSCTCTTLSVIKRIRLYKNRVTSYLLNYGTLHCREWYEVSEVIEDDTFFNYLRELHIESLCRKSAVLRYTIFVIGNIQDYWIISERSQIWYYSELLIYEALGIGRIFVVDNELYLSSLRYRWSASGTRRSG